MEDHCFQQNKIKLHSIYTFYRLIYLQIQQIVVLEEGRQNQTALQIWPTEVSWIAQFIAISMTTELLKNIPWSPWISDPNKSVTFLPGMVSDQQEAPNYDERGDSPPRNRA